MAERFGDLLSEAIRRVQREQSKPAVAWRHDRVAVPARRQNRHRSTQKSFSPA
jgi:hypothetical protein